MAGVLAAVVRGGAAGEGALEAWLRYIDRCFGAEPVPRRRRGSPSPPPPPS